MAGQVGFNLEKGTAGCLTIQTVAPNEQTKSVVPHLRRSTGHLWTQPFRAGLMFGAGPLGLDCKHRFPHVHSSLNLPQASRLLLMTKGRVGVSNGNWFEGSQVSESRPGHPSISPFEPCREF